LVVVHENLFTHCGAVYGSVKGVMASFAWTTIIVKASESNI